jgi:hypothetical protein
MWHPSIWFLLLLFLFLGCFNALIKKRSRQCGRHRIAMVLMHSARIRQNVVDGKRSPEANLGE